MRRGFCSGKLWDIGKRGREDRHSGSNGSAGVWVSDRMQGMSPLPREPSPPYYRGSSTRNAFQTHTCRLHGFVLFSILRNSHAPAQAPTYRLAPDPASPDGSTCLIIFSAGPPYEDIAFRCVRVWPGGIARGQLSGRKMTLVQGTMGRPSIWHVVGWSTALLGALPCFGHLGHFLAFGNVDSLASRHFWLGSLHTTVQCDLTKPVAARGTARNRIVNKEWEYSHKRGFKCTYDRGILHVYFNFQRTRYRR